MVVNLRGLGVEHLPTMCETLGLIPSKAKITKDKKRRLVEAD